MTRILLVDDESSVLKSISRLLHKEHLDITTTTSPRQALQYLENQCYTVVVADQHMPEMMGIQVLERSQEISPDTIRIILTGYADVNSALMAISKGAVYRFIAKPWNDEELLVTLRQAVAQFKLVRENRRLRITTEKQNAELKQFNQLLEQKVVERTDEIAQLNAQLTESFQSAIQAAARLSEMHSSVVGNHSKRVAAHSKVVAQHMGLAEDAVFEIEVAATLHDIGKMGLAPHILSTPESRLTPTELDAFRQHVTRGETILKKLPNVGAVPQIVRYHHECFNGAGHPDRLKGREIPIGSRIIAVADAYDNALNRRPSFQSTDSGKVLKYIQRFSSQKFDPEVVKSFVHCLRSDPKFGDSNEEIEITMKDMREGMVLSRDLRTVRGILLLPKGSKIKKTQLVRIRQFHESDPIIEGLYVYRKNRIGHTEKEQYA